SRHAFICAQSGKLLNGSSQASHLSKFREPEDVDRTQIVGPEYFLHHVEARKQFENGSKVGIAGADALALFTSVIKSVDVERLGVYLGQRLPQSGRELLMSRPTFGTLKNLQHGVAENTLALLAFRVSSFLHCKVSQLLPAAEVEFGDGIFYRLVAV